MDGRARAVFTVDPRVRASTAAVGGEWSGWSSDADVMRGESDGGFSLTVDLDVGRSDRFRYLLDGWRGENDGAADGYVPNRFGSDHSVVDLRATALVGVAWEEPGLPEVAPKPRTRRAGGSTRGSSRDERPRRR